MITVTSIIHLLASIALVLIVLLQTGRGSDIGAAFGSGASQTLFGTSGTSGFMTKLTTVVVIVFMATSLGLAIMYSNSRRLSVSPAPQRPPIGQNVPAQVPAQRPPAQAPPAGQPAPQPAK